KRLRRIGVCFERRRAAVGGLPEFRRNGERGIEIGKRGVPFFRARLETSTNGQGPSVFRIELERLFRRFLGRVRIAQHPRGDRGGGPRVLVCFVVVGDLLRE